jgi:hypothetical protein
MSAPEIDYNKLRENGLEYAVDQLRYAAEALARELSLRESPEEVIRKLPTPVMATALLAHLDERAEERRILKVAELEKLQEISDSLVILSGGVMQLIVGELKERWLISHQNHTEAELKAAMSYYDSMAVRGSGLKHDDK